MYMITGASGFLGSAVIKTLLDETDENIIAVSRTEGCFASSPRVETVLSDVRDTQRLEALAEKHSSDKGIKLLCLAASHNMDFVEKNPAQAADVNITALQNITELFRNRDALFFASTDAVYGEGAQGARFCETDKPQPVSEYGRQKLKAEKIVTDSGGKALRLPYMYGRSLNPSRRHFADKIIDKLTRGETVSLFTDVIRSALDYNSVAQIILKLFSKADNEMPDILNLCGDESLSRYEIGNRIAEDYSLDKGLIIPCESSKSSILKAHRALNGAMDNSLLRATLGVQAVVTAKI